MVWRQLYLIGSRMLEKKATDGATDGASVIETEEMFAMLGDCFYSDVTRWPEKTKVEWMDWLSAWSQGLSASSSSSLSAAVERMRVSSPKYVPREWMLVEAYEQAQVGSYDTLKELAVLFENPYDEQSELENK